MIGIALCVHIDAISLLEQPTKKPGKESKPINFFQPVDALLNEEPAMPVLLLYYKRTI